MQGWIKLHRKIEQNDLWLSEPFTKGQAWVDIILLANHKRQVLFKRGIKVVINRGEVGWSEDALAHRWKWSRGKVRRFLKYLKTVQQIEQQKSHTLSRIIILNYDSYQENGTTDGTTDGTINKNVKNVKNISEQSSVNTPMPFNKFSDEYEEGVVDLDSGELHNPEEASRLAEKEQNQKFRKAVDWLIEHQGRDPKRTSVPKQLKAIKKLYTMKVSAGEAKQVILECEGSPQWQGRLEKPDYWTVVSIIQKRG